MYSAHIMQANHGCDFDFLETKSAAGSGADPEIH
jgi:hypothetical protein